ncbi:TerD family protein [Nocardioides sp. YIM 152315]|uniref:TerD family protein n=1 Tax=Nocardioides sp. YIM 152315 TaxID=3031760 RepID=UPI0023DA7D4F|nr:TerD family protein [Nocardioides sp. YIM 152315]MDF1606154.1 TerD family protein [Nocardioides sp. YIM 152315]
MIELQIGQEVELAGKLRMGLGWDKVPHAGALSAGARDVDLDASAIEFGGGRLFDIAFYNNTQTRDGSVVHLGDNLTGSGEGDDELIGVDLGRVHPQIDTIFLLVTSYQGQTLEWIANAYCRVLGEDDVEVARVTLTLGIPDTGVVLARITRDGDRWRLRALGEPVPVQLPTESERALKRLL